MPSAMAAATTVASKTLLVGIVAASGLCAATAFGFGSALSPSAAVMASAAGGEPSRASGVSRRHATTMTEKPSRVFVAGASGRLGQRVVRWGGYGPRVSRLAFGLVGRRDGGGKGRIDLLLALVILHWTTHPFRDRERFGSTMRVGENRE